MENSVPPGIRLSQKDVGLAVLLLGLSYAIGFISPLNYIGLVIGLVAVILLLVRRNDLSIRQAHVLYTSIILYILSYIVFVIAIIAEVFSIVGGLVSHGYSGSSLPTSAVYALINFVLVGGSVFTVIIVLCYFMIPFFMVNRRLQYALTGGFLISVGLKILGIYLASSLLSSLSSVNTSSILSLANSVPYRLPSIAISLASTLSLGVLIIYIGNQIRVGRIDFVQREDENP